MARKSEGWKLRKGKRCWTVRFTFAGKQRELGTGEEREELAMLRAPQLYADFIARKLPSTSRARELAQLATALPASAAALGIRIKNGKAFAKFEVPSVERAEALRALARDLQRGNVEPARAEVVLRDAAGASEQGFGALRELVRELVAPKAPPGVRTFRAVGEEWTSGELAKRFHQVEKVDGEINMLRLEKHVYPVIGDTPIKEVTRDACDEVIRRLAPTVSQASKRQVAQLVSRVLNLAALAGDLERNPLPRGWLPRKPSRKRYPILYPREDVQLLGCADVPLVFRVFYGVAHREGMRRSELLALRWCDLDLDAGTITCDVNKTALPRFWKLAPGVASALRTWRSQQGELAPDARVFELSKDQVTRAAVGHLQAAKLERADLYSRGPGKGAFGVHCFRRSFVTRSLALGKNEDYVRQRTGHLSNQLLTYRMAARSLAELELGDLEPLERAIPELAPITPVMPDRRGTTGAGVIDLAQVRARRTPGSRVAPP